MVEFGGWSMPVQYQGIVAEHQAVRESVGMFDISHMGKFDIKGDQPLQALQPLVPSDLSQLQPGQAKYTVFLNPDGGIVDDLIVYCHSQRMVSLIVNAATTAKDWAWLQTHLDVSQVDLIDQTVQLALIALQGPKAATTLQALVDIDLSQVKSYHHSPATLDLGVDSPYAQAPLWLARTGYTGEDGFELMVPTAVVSLLWQRLLTLGVVPCGLGSRDTLRLEAAMALYGQDIDETTSPLEAGLGWLVHWDKGEFIGRSALELQKSQGLSRRLVGFKMNSRQIPRHDYPILVAGNRVGTVTSGSFAPTLGVPIGLGYVAAELASLDQEIAVEIRGIPQPASVLKRPFYQRA